MDTKQAGVTGEHTTNGRPHGTTSLTPHIVVSPATAALEFYASVLGASVVDVMRTGEQVAHAVLRFESGRLTLSDPLPAYELIPQGSGSVCYSLALYVPNVDEVVQSALQAGATLREPVSTFVSGDRFASILDPFGVRWAIMTRVEDLSEAASSERVARWAEANMSP